MSKKKKTTPTDVLRARSQSRPFIDGFDSYCAEYDFWKSLGLVRGLLGVFALSNQDMVEKDTYQLLAELGFGEHEHLTHLIQVDNSERSTDRTTGGGGNLCSPVRTAARAANGLSLCPLQISQRDCRSLTLKK